VTTATLPGRSRGPQLTERQRDRLRRLKHGYPYWASQCYTILDKELRTHRMQINAVQQAIGAAEAKALAEHGEARLYILKGRQSGVTTDQQARALHTIWSRRGASAITVAHNREDTDKIFAITTRAIDHFPPGLLHMLGERETREITFPELDTRFYTGTAGAKRTGRSITLARLHGSEFAFWDDPVSTLNAATPALIPHGSVIALETTANAFGSEAHLFWQEAQKGLNSYVPLFFPWWMCDPIHYRLPLLAKDELGRLEPDEQALVSRHGLSHEQLKWRRAKIRDMTRTEFIREYPEDPESCWVAAGAHFYDVALLQLLFQRTPAPRETHLGGALQLFDELAKGERAIIGADVAEGVAGDRSSFKARAFPSWKNLAAYANDRITPDDFADLLNTWGRTLGTALLVIEKNAHGITVLRRLRDHHKYPVSRLYHRVPVDRDTPVEEERTRLGWHTSGESKPILLDGGHQLLAAARDGTAAVPSEAALKDALSVHRDKNGAVELTGRDVWTAELLAWVGRGYPITEITRGGALV
jgi:hypothetical protein